MFKDLDENTIYVVFFSSKDVVSTCIRKFEKIWFWKKKTLFSHVGILFHERILDVESKTKLCRPSESFLVLESTMSGPLNDNVKNTCKRVKFGVQVRKFNSLIKHYRKNKGKIAVCKLKKLNERNEGNEGNESQKRIFNQVLKDYLSKRYDIILTNLLTVHIPVQSIYSGRVFCSELVCLILQQLGVISNEIDPKKVSPNSVFDLTVLSEPMFFVH